MLRPRRTVWSYELLNSLVTIETYQSPLPAEVARDYLINAGIRAYLLDEHVVSVNNLWANALGGVKLQVAREDEPAARKLLQEIEEERQSKLNPEPVVFRCSQCHQPQEFPGERRGRVESCTKCRAFIDVPEESDAELVLELQNAQAARNKLADKAASDESPSGELRIGLRCELLGVLAIFYLPHLVSALIGMSEAYGGYIYGVHDLIYVASGALPSVVSVLMILKLQGENWKRFGIVKPRIFLDCALGLGLWLLMHLVWVISLGTVKLSILPDMNFHPDQISAPGALGVALCVVAFTANSIAEELCVRGYLITRLRDIGQQRLWALLISAVLFGSYHLYQGWIVACLITVQGMVLGLAFVVIKRIWPLVIAHTIFNLWAAYQL